MRLIAENLSGERGGETVFRGVGFALGDGESLVVTGPNGSGKSTLLRVVAGLLPHVHGRITVEGGGEDFSTVAAACHYLGHQNAMKAALTVARESRVLAELCRRSAGSASARRSKMVGLGGIGHLPFGYLSTGQKRRAAIAKLLDQPPPGLAARRADGRARQGLRSAVRRPDAGASARQAASSSPPPTCRSGSRGRRRWRCGLRLRHEGEG